MERASAMRHSQEFIRRARVAIVVCLAAHPVLAHAANEACETVRVANIGYMKDAQGRYAVIPDTNMTRYEVVMAQCRKGNLDWKTRHFYGAADSIDFNHHRYWCVNFTDGGRNYRFVRNATRSDCR